MPNDKILNQVKEPNLTVTPRGNVPPQSSFTPMMRKAGVIIFILFLIGGSIYLVKNKPKTAMYVGGGVVLLFVWAYFFLAFWGPSRYQKWKAGSGTPKTPVTIK